MTEKRLPRNALLSVAQVIASALLLVVLYRALAIHLGMALIGLWSLLVASLSLGRIGELGISAAVVRGVARALAEGHPRKAASVVWHGITFVAAVLGLLLVVMYPVVVWILRSLVHSPEYATVAVASLPILLTSLWIASVGSVLIGALDGAQNVGQKAIVVVGANIVFAVVALSLLGSKGFEALPAAHLAQSVFLFGTALILVTRMIPLWRFSSLRMNRDDSLGLLSFGAQVQAGAVAQMFFDPATKALLAHFGSLAFVGNFEVASRLVMYARSVVVSAFLPMAAVVANMERRGEAPEIAIYPKAYLVLSFIVPCFFGILAVSLPLIGHLWLGHASNQFLLAGWFSCVGWGINAYAAAAYTANLGMGDPSSNTQHHVLCGVLNVSFGYVGGFFLGPVGVLAGSMLSLGLSSIWLVKRFHSRHGVVSGLLPREMRGLTVVSSAISLFVCGATLLLDSKLSQSVLGLGSAVIITALVYRHPTAELLKRLIAKGLR
jgi:O-antigen/teichoic acid export membrane protein